MALPEIIKDIEARVKDTGDIMTGNLYIDTDACPGVFFRAPNGGYSNLFKNSSATVEDGTHIKDTIASGAYVALLIRASDGIASALRVTDGTSTCTILHTGNMYNHLDGEYVNIAGDTMTGQLKFGGANGIQTRHIDGESVTFAGDLYLNYNVNAPIHVGHGGTYTISADGSTYSGAAAKLFIPHTTWYNVTGSFTREYEGHDATTNKIPSPYVTVLSMIASPARGSAIAVDWRTGVNALYFNNLHDDTASFTWGTWRKIWVEGNAVTGAVWNDYAECREADIIEPGYVLVETGNDTLTKSTERLSPFAGVSSDTWGFSQGETDKAKTPIAVAGRVLVYPWQDRNNYKPGDCVCAAPEGKVDIMTREEIIQYPDRIVGTVSSVPTYDKWGGGEMADREPVDVNGRIWIKVR